MKIDSMMQTGHGSLRSNDYSIEVTGLGIIAALAIAFAGLVSDGMLPLSQYLGFLGFLLVGADGLVWRILWLAPARVRKSDALRIEDA